MSAELLFIAGMLGMIAGLLPFAIYEYSKRMRK
jgi:hypothetical protein